MATTIVYPNGDGTVTGLGGTSGPPYYVNIDEGTDSPNDSDAVSLSTTSGFFTLTDMPVDFVTITAVTIKARTANSSKSRKIASCQIFKSDETTALTSSATISGSTTITTYTLNPTITGSTDKTSWDGARIKFVPDGSSGAAHLYAVQVEITYDTGGGGGGTAKAVIFYQHNQQNNNIGG